VGFGGFATALSFRFRFVGLTARALRLAMTPATEQTFVP
jgi:hypothetical protein